MNHSLFMETCQNVISIIFIVFVLSKCLRNRIHRTSIYRRQTTLGSHIWSRRRIFWRHAKVSRASYIAHALKTRYYDNYKLEEMQQYKYSAVDTRQYSEHPQSQDMDQVNSTDQPVKKLNHSGCTVTVVLLLLVPHIAFGMLGLYNEDKCLDLTSTSYGDSGVQDDKTIYANNFLFLGMGPGIYGQLFGGVQHVCI